MSFLRPICNSEVYIALIKMFRLNIEWDYKKFEESNLEQKKPTFDWLMSGWPDLNRRPPAPHAGAIPGYATSRKEIQIKERERL